MNEEQTPLYFPVLVPGSKEENLQKEGAYYERALDGFVFFVEQAEPGTDLYRVVQASAVGPDKISKKDLWTAALENVFHITHAGWNPSHSYLLIKTDPSQFSSAAILQPYLHEYLSKVFEGDYMVLPYSTEHVVACPMMDPDDILEGYRQDLQEHPEKSPLSNRLYLVEDGVMTVYPDTSSAFVPIVLEDPEEQKKKDKYRRRKKHAKQQYLN